MKRALTLLVVFALSMTSCALLKLNEQTRYRPASDFPSGLEVGGFESSIFDWGKPKEFTSIFDNPQPTAKKPKL